MESGLRFEVMNLKWDKSAWLKITLLYIFRHMCTDAEAKIGFNQGLLPSFNQKFFKSKMKQEGNRARVVYMEVMGMFIEC